MAAGGARAYVWSRLWDVPVVVGRLDLLNERQAEFFYAPSYLERQQARPLDPQHLPLPRNDNTVATRYPIALVQHAFQGVIGDAAPDAWGRRVLLHLHPRSIKTAIDGLLRMDGHGTGSLLFSGSSDACKPPAPPPRLDQLGAALEAAEAVELGRPIDSAVRHLMAAGSSLGGMRPKIVAEDENGHQWIAKFPSHQDAGDIPRLEVATMKLARLCGIDACKARFVALGGRSVALIPRFDRPQGNLDSAFLHYASAHGLWNRGTAREDSTLDWASYGGIGDLVRAMVVADQIAETLRELFRRMAFNVLIGNTDDHGKNHGFLMDAAGHWRLAPAFDLVPTLGADTRYQALGIGPNGRERSLDNLLAGAGRLGIKPKDARAEVDSLRTSIGRHWTAGMNSERVSKADREAARGRWLDAEG